MWMGPTEGLPFSHPRRRIPSEGSSRPIAVTLDPHKWLFQPYETGCLMVRDTRLLEDAFRILPEYLQDTALGEEHVNFADRGIQLTRGFRALKVWMSIQTLGLGAFREAIQTGIDLAREAERFIDRSRDLEMLGPAALGIVCFRFRNPDVELSPETLEELNTAYPGGGRRFGPGHDVVHPSARKHSPCGSRSSTTDLPGETFRTLSKPWSKLAIGSRRRWWTLEPDSPCSGPHGEGVPGLLSHSHRPLLVRERPWGSGEPSVWPSFWSFFRPWRWPNSPWWMMKSPFHGSRSTSHRR